MPADIKLLDCCHQPAAVPENPLSVPIQVETALAEGRFSGFSMTTQETTFPVKSVAAVS